MEHLNQMPKVTKRETQKPVRVVVIGGGAAGLIAAGAASQFGAHVTIIEKMERPGRKLRITGKGRCNLTNDTPLDEFLNHFGKNSRFLKPAFYQFFVKDLLILLGSQGIETVVERGNRIFPASNQAQDVVDALTGWVKRQGTTLMPKTKADRIIIENGQIVGVSVVDLQTMEKEIVSADSVILSTGGMSYPLTGSTGDGYKLASAVGHSIVPIRPALIPLITSGETAQNLQGLSLKNVAASLWIDGKKQASEFGEMLFTHFGLSGPIILTLSKQAVDALNEKKKVSVSIDLKPALDDIKLDARLLRDFGAHGKMQYRKILHELLPPKMIPVCIESTGIPPDKLCSQITGEERKHLRLWLKDFRLEVVGHRPISEAIITAGGVNLKEIDPKTMGSRLVKGLHFAGEVLDIDADTGGYNLQAAFSTGWLAGKSAAEINEQ
ncbi:MAG: NAD(P)/FAD-dependent oxidoreductase [Candidatus Marinimicrobia bacterium]|nr:NAD(P)/FAD-dependent oxidoreductase [Candidatus Neomarinimicrobiota bacterium]